MFRTKSKGFGDNRGGSRFLSVCTFHFKCIHLHKSVERVVKISRPTYYYDVYNTRITGAVISSTGYICGVHTDRDSCTEHRNSGSSSIIYNTNIIYRRSFIDATTSMPPSCLYRITSSARTPHAC